MSRKGWQTKRLKEIAPLQRGFDLTKDQLRNGKVPVISSSGLWGYHDEAKVKGPGIVIGRYGTIGEVFFVEEDFWPHNTTLWVTDFCGNDPNFVNYLYSALDVSKHSGKTGVPGLNRNDLHTVKIPLPPLTEQQKIAAILATWDRAIELTEKLIAAKQKRKQALMQQLLTCKVRFAEFTEKSWEWIPLGDLTKSAKRPIKWNDEQLYKLASIRRHSKGMFYREPAYGHQIKVKKLFTLNEGDFLISNIQAAYGALGLVPKKFHGSYISDQYTVLISKDPGEFDIRFLGFISELPWFRHQILMACNGFFAERLRLLFSADELLKRKLFVPPTVEEQRRIVSVLSTATTEIQTEIRKLKQLQLQKKGLMQQLLTGKIRVKVEAEVTRG